MLAYHDLEDRLRIQIDKFSLIERSKRSTITLVVRDHLESPIFCIERRVFIVFEEHITRQAERVTDGRFSVEHLLVKVLGEFECHFIGQGIILFNADHVAYASPFEDLPDEVRVTGRDDHKIQLAGQIPYLLL